MSKWRFVIAALIALSGMAEQGYVPLSVTAEGELQVSARNVSVDAANQVQLLAKVLDQDGRPVPGLAAGSFFVKAADREFAARTVQSVVDAQIAISSLLVIDTSGSMQGSPLEDARQAASQYIGIQDPIDSVGVIAFSNDVQVVSDYSKDLGGVQDTLQALSAVGNTSLFEAVVVASESISQRGSGRSVVILLSDGENFGPSTTTRAQALAAAKASAVPFYVIGIGPSLDQQFLDELSEVTQGEMYLAPSSGQLASIFSRVAEVLRSEYLVTVDLHESGLHGETEASLEVRITAGSGQTPITLQLPVVQVQVQRTPVQNVPAPLAVPETREAGDNSLLIWVLVALLVVVLSAGAGAYAKQWYDRREPTYGPTPRPPAEPPSHDGAPLVSRESPWAILQDDSGKDFRFSGLATLGVDSTCSLRIPVSPTAFGHGEVRVWFTDQRYLIHDISPRSRIRVNGKTVGWCFLSDGDEIEVCGVTLRFLSEGSAPAQRY
ncbi:MAG TPA: VWA domain-containing protein [Dehalococcoidia bacterium]|nr:VWA domain-containing protein [Dehalococcoidia bacterium]